MPSDAITLSAVCKELNAALLNGKIEKVYQPENDELTFAVKSGGRTHTLVISANAGLPRIHLTSHKKENPLAASTFCMLMRKHTGGGIIQNVSLLDWDRIIKIELLSRNEMGDKTSFFILAELMGRYSNIILTNSDYIILDAIKRVNFDQNPDRPIVPSARYTPALQRRATPGDEAALEELFAEEKPYNDKYLLENIGGLAKDTAKEILSRSPQAPLFALKELRDIYNSELYHPCVRFDDKDNAADFYITPYQSVPGRYEYFSTLNEAMDEFYSKKDAELRKRANTKELTTLLERLRKKTERRIADYTSKLEECGRSDILRIYGELILSNLHRMKKGDKSLSCENFYDGNAITTVPLDELLSPNKNAQSYFKKYTKLKHAKEIALAQLEALSIQGEHLNALSAAIKSSDTRQEYQEILDELRALDGKKPQAAKQKKQKPSEPIHIVFEGADIFVGKNSIQNNKVTFDLASSGDVWLHAKNYHGAHVVIKGASPSDSVLRRAAELCAYYSETKDSPKAEIDYTLRKNVKRHKSGVPGLVNYTDFKTIIVEPKP